MMEPKKTTKLYVIESALRAVKVDKTIEITYEGFLAEGSFGKTYCVKTPYYLGGKDRGFVLKVAKDITLSFDTSTNLHEEFKSLLNSKPSTEQGAREEVLKSFKREFDVLCCIKKDEVASQYAPKPLFIGLIIENNSAYVAYGMDDLSDDYVTLSMLYSNNLVKRGINLALNVGIPLGKAIHSFHKLGIKHRDLAPQNIFVGKDALKHDTLSSADIPLKIIDFGQTTEDAFSDASSSSTTTHLRNGTATYAAPEMLMVSDFPGVNKSDWDKWRTHLKGLRNSFAPDIWSYGALLYSACWGTTALTNKLWSSFDKTLRAKAEGLRYDSTKGTMPPESCEAKLDAIIQQCTPCCVDDSGALVTSAFEARRNQRIDEIVNRIVALRGALRGPVPESESIQEFVPVSTSESEPIQEFVSVDKSIEEFITDDESEPKHKPKHFKKILGDGNVVARDDIKGALSEQLDKVDSQPNLRGDIKDALSESHDKVSPWEDITYNPYEPQATHRDQDMYIAYYRVVDADGVPLYPENRADAVIFSDDIRDLSDEIGFVDSEGNFMCRVSAPIKLDSNRNRPLVNPYMKDVMLAAFPKPIYPTNMSFWFANYETLSEFLSFENLKTQNVENMNGLFYGCRSLEELDLSTFDLSKDPDMHLMFSECESLKKLTFPHFQHFNSPEDIDNFVRGKAIDMFKGCNPNLTIEGSAAIKQAFKSTFGEKVSPEATEEEKTLIVLESFGDNKISVIKVVREITSVGLKEAKEFVEEAPNVGIRVPKKEAVEIKKILEDAGATVSLE